jgi:tetratricopeptide (TPR) repeat protein
VNPSYRQIADLFGFSAPEAPDIGDTGLRKKLGDTAQESAELGSLSLSEGDYAKAIDHFRRAIEQTEGKDPSRELDLGSAFEFADMEPQALRQYRSALRVRAAAPEPHLGIAELYKREGRRRQAIVELETALTANPNNPYFQFKLAELLDELGQREDALTAIQHAVAGAATDSFYHYWMGDLLLRMRRYELALEAFRAAIELSPGDDFLYSRAAAAFWLARKPQEAVKAIRLASDLDPDKHLYHGILELFLGEMDLHEEADLEASRAAKMDAYDLDLLRRFADEVGLVA